MFPNHAAHARAKRQTMNNNFSQIQELLNQRAEYNARLSLLPYDGTPEIKDVKNGKYLYIRKRVAGKLTTTYVGLFSEELYNALLRYAREARELRKNIRQINRALARLGYAEGELSERVLNNLDFARANLKANIYDQAVLEGVATSFPQTEEIIENGIVSGMTASDIQKVLNLRKAGAQAVLISNCTDCTNTVMSCAPQLGLPVYHCTDGALRAVNDKLVRRMHKHAG